MPIYKTKEKKDGLTKYRVRVNYTDDLGKAHSLTRIAYGQEAAKRLESTLIKDNNKAACNLTVSKLIDKYLMTKQYEVRESSLDKSRRILNKYIRPVDQRISKLNVRFLSDWKLSIDKLKLATTTKKNIYREFNALLNWAVRMEYLQSNSLKKVGNFRNAYEQERQFQYYTPDEFTCYAAAAWEFATENDFYDYYVFFCIAYYTGARKGEIHALHWTDIDGSLLHITKSLNQKLKGKDRITPPKNKSSNRTLQLPDPLINILHEHYDRGKAFKDFNDDFFVCGGLQPLRDTSLSNANFAIAKRAGLHHIRIHDFRHSHASLLANAGINILEISRRLGHSNIEQTLNTYSHFYPKEEERAVKILNEIRVEIV